MKRTTAWTSAVLTGSLTAACNPDQTFSGTAVGNPTKGLTFRTVPDPSITSLEGRLLLADVTLRGCEGVAVPLATGVTLSAVGGSELRLAPGSYCGVEVTLGGQLAYLGQDAQGRTFDVKLETGALSVPTAVPFDTSDAPLVFTLGQDGWLSAESLELDDFPNRTIAPGVDGHDDLVEAVRRGLGLFADADGDGVRSAGEVVLGGPGAASDDDTDDDSDDDSPADDTGSDD